MIRSFIRRGLRLGALVGAVLFLVRAFQRRQPSPSPSDLTSAARPQPLQRPQPSPAESSLGAAGNGSTAALLAEPTAPAVAPSRSSGTTAETSAAPGKVEAPAAPTEPAPAASETPSPSPASPAPAKATKSAAKATKAAKAKSAKATKASKTAKPKAPKKAATSEVSAWVEPVEGAAPPSHPVKAKVSSKIYHLPGMLNYDRTTPDRCYRDAEAAEVDGFRKAQR